MPTTIWRECNALVVAIVSRVQVTDLVSDVEDELVDVLGETVSSNNPAAKALAWINCNLENCVHLFYRKPGLSPNTSHSPDRLHRQGKFILCLIAWDNIECEGPWAVHEKTVKHKARAAAVSVLIQ